MVSAVCGVTTRARELGWLVDRRQDKYWWHHSRGRQQRREVADKGEGGGGEGLKAAAERAAAERAAAERGVERTLGRAGYM